MNTQSLLRASLTAGILLTAVGSQAQTYLYQKISASPNVQTFALEVTDDGRIGGWTTDYIHVNGFVDNAGTFTTTKIPSYSETQVTAINGGTIYGIANANSGFSISSTGTVSILRPPSFAALPNGANGKGVVVGQAQTSQGNQPAFVLQNGTYQSFLFPGSNVTNFVAVNNLDVIAGTWNVNGGPLQSFELKNGETTPIVFPSAYSTIVTGINDAGEVIGWYQAVPQAAPTMFLYDGTSYFQIVPPANSYACTTRHLNNAGDFVGTCSDNTTKQQYSFLATPAEVKTVVLPPQ